MRESFPSPTKLLHRQPHSLQHRLRILKNLVIPEAKHKVSPVPQPLVPAAVRCRAMLAAIGLDDQLQGGTEKVHDIGAKGHLAAEFQAQETAGAQVVPETLFRFGLVLAQVAGVSQQGL